MDIPNELNQDAEHSFSRWINYSSRNNVFLRFGRERNSQLFFVSSYFNNAKLLKIVRANNIIIQLGSRDQIEFWNTV